MMALTQQLWEFPLNFVELLVLCAVLNSFFNRVHRLGCLEERSGL